MGAAVSKNTHRAHAVGLNSYNKFCEANAVDAPWPPTLRTIIQYLLTLSSSGLAFSTVRAYISAISYHCKINQMTDPSTEFIVVKLLQGMKRLRHKPDTRLPITKDVLQQLLVAIRSICTNSFEKTMFAAAFTLAFYGLLRVGEFTVASKNDAHCILKRSDVTLDTVRSSISITIPFSKTDQMGRGTVIHISSTDDTTCPFRCMQSYLHIRPHKNEPIFCHFDSSPLTRFQFTSVLSKSLKHINLSNSNYKSHSFRIGASTDLALKGFSSDIIQKSGRWKSQCYKSYIRIPKF